MISCKFLQNIELDINVNKDILDYEDKLGVDNSLRGFIVMFATS
jgi:hypothetical protein